MIVKVSLWLALALLCIRLAWETVDRVFFVSYSKISRPTGGGAQEATLLLESELFGVRMHSELNLGVHSPEIVVFILPFVLTGCVGAIYMCTSFILYRVVRRYALPFFVTSPNKDGFSNLSQ
jgi:hypothetical protein